jgi:hypothetical protein
MKSIGLLKLALISASFLSVGVVSIKIVEVHFHFGPSTATAASTPPFKVEKNQEIEDHWNVELPADEEWHNTGLTLPANRRYLSLHPIGENKDLTGLTLRIGHAQYVIKYPSGAYPVRGFHVDIIESVQGKPVELKNEKEGVNNSFKVEVSFADDYKNQQK